MYINNHAARDEPEAKIFPLTYMELYHRIRGLGKKILSRKLHPHQFRHTRATEDSEYFTDREMMLRHG